MFNLKLHSFAKIISIISILFVGFLAIPVHSATFLSNDEMKKDSIEITENKENFYAAGKKIKVSSIIRKDLVVSGGEVEITAKVERSLLVAGGTVKVNSQLIGSSTRIAGGSVELSGIFNDDVIITGGNIKIKDAQIKGDLVVSGGDVSVLNSKINGKFIGSYGNIDGDLKSQVKGEIQEAKFERGKNDFTFVSVILKFGQEFSVFIGLIFLVIFLNRRKKLEVSEIKINTRFALDIISTLGFLLIPVIIFGISILLQFYTLVLTLWGIVILSFSLSVIYLPIYLANLIKNHSKLKLSLPILSGLSYLFLLVIGIIPYIQVIGGVLVFILFLANYGFIVRKFLTLLNKGLSKEIEEKPSN